MGKHHAQSATKIDRNAQGDTVKIRGTLDGSPWAGVTPMPPAPSEKYPKA